VVQDPTKARLLEAAGEEFAEKGFEGATVRVICERAGANQAAVNYHFGDKEQLYEQAVLHAHRCGPGMAEDVGDSGSPAEDLRLYVAMFLRNVVALKSPTWHQTLMLREMVNPTRASETLVRESIRPRFEKLSSIIRRLCPGADDRRVHALAFSVVGQCLHYKLTRSISERLVGPEGFEQLDIDYLIDHITRFTLAALGEGPPFCSGCDGPSVPAQKGAVG
jgi:TetR/AcrR family transcriptional regulator, regulator of cefoperazone and chloramphenicol sensitivity